MKKLLLLLPIVAALFLSSCSHTIIPVSTFEGNYQKRMLSNSDKEIKSTVSIFTSESEIKDTFEVISVNNYKPWFSIPIIYSGVKQMRLKFYQKAAQQAYAAGGNGVLVEGIGHYKVLKVYSGISPVTLTDKFENGTILNASDKEKIAYYDSYFLEISKDISNVAKSSDVGRIKTKIQVFENHNKSLPKPNKKINKRIKVLTSRVYLKEYELLRQEQLNAQRAAKDNNNTNYDVEKISQWFVAERFENGTVLSASEDLQKRYESLFVEEIEDNTDAAITLEHLEIIKRKIDVLDDYCKKCKNSSSLSYKIKALEKSVEHKRKKIEKKK